MDVKNCFDKRLLRKIGVDLEKSKNSINKAEDKLERARKLFNKDFFEEVILSAYSSMFHIARALLYRDGIQEKSHYAIYIYLTEKYSSEIGRELLECFRNYQIERHQVVYGFEVEKSGEKSEMIIDDAERFLIKIKRLLKNG